MLKNLQKNTITPQKIQDLKKNTNDPKNQFLKKII